MTTSTQPLLDKLTNGDEFTHTKLVRKAQEFAREMNKALTVLKKRQGKYDKVAQLKDEMAQAMEHMNDDTWEGRSVTKIASDLKRANNAIDSDMDKVFEQLDQLQGLQNEIAQLGNKIGNLSFMDEIQ